MSELQEELERRNIPVKLHLGAEVFYLPNLLELKDTPPCTLGNRRYMLIEFALHSLPEGYKEVLFDLKMAGVTPIIAHPERYRPIQEDVEIARHMVRAGALIQIDAGSLLGTLGQRANKSSRELLQQRLCHLIGSDAHDDKKRNFCLPKTIEVGRELIGTEIEEIVFANPKRLLNGEPIEADVLEAAIPTQGLFSKFRRRFLSR
jgi:protein-tyrosine phosphatase